MQRSLRTKKKKEGVEDTAGKVGGQKAAACGRVGGGGNPGGDERVCLLQGVATWHPNSRAARSQFTFRLCWTAQLKVG